MTLNEIIIKFAQSYPSIRTQPFRSNYISKLISGNIPIYLNNELHLDNTDYLTKGSCGNGNWSDIPWFSIMNRNITETTQDGYYIVYLFNTNFETIYVSLALGWTQFFEKYKTKQGKVEIQRIANYLSMQLRIKPKGFNSGVISLNAKNDLGRGYELGQILSKEYQINQLPSENELLNDLRSLLGTYDELVGLVGNSIFNIEMEDIESPDEKEFKSIIARESLNKTPEFSLKKLTDIANTKPAQIRKKMIKQIMRNNYYANYVKTKASYICEICGRDPFIQKNGKPYAEADHIEQLSKGKIDHPDNMRCLCPQCHAIITYGSDEEVNKLFENNT